MAYENYEVHTPKVDGREQPDAWVEEAYTTDKGGFAMVVRSGTRTIKVTIPNDELIGIVGDLMRKPQ